MEDSCKSIGALVARNVLLSMNSRQDLEDIDTDASKIVIIPNAEQSEKKNSVNTLKK